jgi:hypothetical protein
MSSLGTDRPRFVLHPVLLAAAYVLSVALEAEADPDDFARPLVAAVTAAIVLTLVGWALFRNRWDGGLLATGLILLAISLRPLAALWGFLSGLLGPTGGSAVIGLLLVAGLGVPLIAIRRARRRRAAVPRPSAGLLNGFSLALVVVTVAWNLVGHAPAMIGRAPASADAVNVPARAEQPPDIVVILADGYPRSDVLERRLGIDNSEFLAGLRQRGFDVATDSQSNYTWTATTLASMFHMRYLDEIEQIKPLLGTAGYHFDALRDAINAGPALATLRSAGYEIVTAPPGWLHVSLADASDRVLDHGELNDLERILLWRTWLVDVIDVIEPGFLLDTQRERIIHHFDDLEAFAAQQRDRPTFVFLHVPAPHMPLVVDAAGNPSGLPSRSFETIDPNALPLTRAEFLAAWANQLAYVNRRLLGAVDALQASEHPPVIVVMADHGYTYERDAGDNQALFGNLFAAFTPGAPGLLADAPTPVNLMPCLLNRYLGTDIPLSPDRFFTWEGGPLVLREVEDPEAVP